MKTLELLDVKPNKVYVTANYKKVNLQNSQVLVEGEEYCFNYDSQTNQWYFANDGHRALQKEEAKIIYEIICELNEKTLLQLSKEG